jgi:hypothetical protein
MAGGGHQARRVQQAQELLLESMHGEVGDGWIRGHGHSHGSVNGRRVSAAVRVSIHGLMARDGYDGSAIEASVAGSWACRDVRGGVEAAPGAGGSPGVGCWPCLCSAAGSSPRPRDRWSMSCRSRHRAHDDPWPLPRPGATSPPSVSPGLRTSAGGRDLGTPAGFHRNIRIVGQPVGFLKLSGAIEAAHISFVTGLTRFLNQRSLPPEAAPVMVHLRHHRTRRALLRRIRGDLPEPTRLVRWRLGERNAAVTPRVGMVRLPATAKRPTQPDRGDQCGHEDHQDHGRE